GFWGLVLWILAVNALVAAAVAAARSPTSSARPLLWLGGAALLVAGNFIYGSQVIRRADAEHAVDGKPEPQRILVAQPDIRREIKWRPEKKAEVVACVLEHARAAAAAGERAGGFDLFVWPETVLPTRLLSDPPVVTRVESWVEREDVPLLLGTQEGYWGRWAGERTWIAHNSALVIYPDGRRSKIYRKMRLVPFSERFPLQKLVPGLGAIDFGQSNFFPGDSLRVWQLELGADSVAAGCLICFESAFPEMARGFVQRGARLLFNITNDFWFERTAGPVQHAEMVIHRAVENRVPIVRCANTGISFVVDPWGRVSHETGLFTQAAFVASVHPQAGSLAARLGDRILWPVVLPLAAALVRGGLRRRRRR
ncbi:MAG: apolipoprotein N-acyltransferase, partial [Candidatus Eisenbacteria bacterium]|nr:apolipoprotein N-acyltransferase [Candidatus Eisenbacteria bacterium]